MEIFANALANAAAGNHRKRFVLNWRAWTSAVSERLHRGRAVAPRLAVLERVNIAPRQSVALIEVEGEKLLVGASQDGSPTFFRLGAEHRDWRGSEDIPLEGTVA